jgi:hypothetical protein
MSSTVTIDRELVAQQGDWVDVVPPTALERTASINPVRAAIADLRRTLARGHNESTLVDLDDTDIGGGDPDLARAIAEDVAARWDD